MVSGTDRRHRGLVARELSFEYPGPVKALAGISLDVDPGQLLVIIGPNGSGKSTLLRCLAGLLEPTAGEVLLDGQPLRRIRPRDRARRIAMVPQFLPALPDVAVLAFVLGGRYAWFERFAGPTANDVRVARDALAQADIAGVEQRFMSELSGGQRQRVLIARALAQQAEILLVDEPTASLDPEHQIRVFALIAELVRMGRSVVVVTHDLNLASQFAGRIVLLDGGGVVAGGAVEDVLQPGVLAPVYGRHLHYGRLVDASGVERPLVVPWRAAPHE